MHSHFSLEDPVYTFECLDVVLMLYRGHVCEDSQQVLEPYTRRERFERVESRQM